MLLSQDGSEEEPSLVALFTFVARDPISQKSMKINPLEPSTMLQKQRFAERQGVADRRKLARKAATQAFADGTSPLRPTWCSSLATASVSN